MYNHNLFFNEKYEIRGKKFDDQINEWSTKYKSLMSIEQKRFLMSIISENKIKNVLEVGIFNGVSSLCILKSGLSANKDFHLYSIDLNNNKDCEINETYCTMPDYSIGNINDYLPIDTLNYIKKMIIDIDKVIPGFASEDNIVYAPSFELGENKYKLSKSFETNVEGLYIGGDASGYFRGLMQAMISGKIISKDILQKSGGIN